ncbi:hypothetical protein BDV19DRAFT_29079 [Aspergillus venezuelensis]
MCDFEWLENIDVPSYRISDFGLQNDASNEVGAAYMLIDELTGTPSLYKDPEPSVEQVQKVYDQWADIQCILQRHPVNEIGTLLFQPDDKIAVGSTTGDRTGRFPQRGPFTNAREYYSTFAEKYLEMIWDNQLFLAYPVNVYLVFKYLKELAEVGRWNAFEADLDDAPFYLKHMDDKGDHILVDDDYNITEIIDWTFARSVPAFEAFGLFLLTADTGALFNSEPGRSSKDDMLAQALGRRDKALGQITSGPELVRRFSFALGMGMNMLREEAETLFHGVVSTATGIKPELGWEVWRQNRLYQWSDDSSLQDLLRRQGEEYTIKKMTNDTQVYNPPRFSTCLWDDCLRPGVRGKSCAQCRMHLCALHLP